MSWLRLFKKNVGDGRCPGNVKNLVLKGVIERFSAVVPLYVGGSAENSYALVLRGDNKVVLFQKSILSQFSQAKIALLQRGDYVEFEVDRKGFGKIETLKSHAWNGWEQCSGQSRLAPAEEAPLPSPPFLTLHTNPNWKE